MRKQILSLILVGLVLCTTAFSHSGRTDSSGGHKDNKNKSGLGPYHYHCGGYPAHLHDGGCPYSTPEPEPKAQPKPVEQAKPEPVKDTITVKSVPKTMYLGEETVLSVTVAPDNGKTVTWASSDSAVVQVSQSGTLKAMAQGTATIVGTTDTGEVRFDVVVETIPAASVSLECSAVVQGVLTLTVGQEAVATATVLPENCSDKAITWTSSDTAIVQVADGKITALKPGNAEVIATTHNGITASIALLVQEQMAEKIKIVYDAQVLQDHVLAKEDTLTVSAEVFPKNTTNQQVEWSVSDSSVLTIENGIVKPQKAGTATITVKTQNEVLDTLDITVKDTGTTDAALGLLAVAAIGGGVVWAVKRKNS